MRTPAAVKARIDRLRKSAIGTIDSVIRDLTSTRLILEGGPGGGPPGSHVPAAAIAALAAEMAALNATIDARDDYEN